MNDRIRYKIFVSKIASGNGDLLLADDAIGLRYYIHTPAYTPT